MQNLQLVFPLGVSWLPFPMENGDVSHFEWLGNIHRMVNLDINQSPLDECLGCASLSTTVDP